MRSHIFASAFMAKGAFGFTNFKILALALKKKKRDNGKFFLSGFEVKKKVENFPFFATFYPFF
jgi:hypothetical protein